MDTALLRSCNESWWRELTKRSKHAILFVDAKIAETFHWNVPFSALLDAEIRGLRNLDPDEQTQPVPADCKKAIFVASGMIIPGSPAFQSIKGIVEGHCFEYCMIVTISSHQTYAIANNHWEEPPMHPSQARGNPFFEKLEMCLLEWMRNANYTAEILHIPLFLGFPVDDCFLTVPFGNMNPMLNENNFHSEFLRIPVEVKEEVQSFVSSWNSLLSALSAKEDIYCVGPFSSIVATRLANLNAAKTRRKTSGNKVSLIFMDRSADLPEVLKCPTTPAMDRILFTLDQFFGHFSDRAVPYKDSEELPGTLYHVTNPSKELFGVCLENSPQEALASAVGALESELKSAELSPTGESGASSPAQRLAACVKIARSDSTFELNNIDLLDVCQALLVVATSSDSKQKHKLWGKLLKRARLPHCSLEKLNRLVASEKLTIDEELLCLSVLFGTKAQESMTWNCETYIGELADRILAADKDGTLPEWLSGLNVGQDELSSRTCAETVFERLASIARLKNVLELGKNGSFLVDLVTRLVNPEFSENLTDLVCKTSGLSDVFKSSFGFGVLGNVVGKAPRPNDAPTIILCVLGGISCSEIAAVKKTVKDSGNKSVKIIIGGTQLVCAKDVLRNTFRI